MIYLLVMFSSWLLYTHTYDQLNRLLNSTGYYVASTGSLSTYGYDENLNYDKMGNINFLQRKTSTTLRDYLGFSYQGNQIRSVYDYVGQINVYDIKEYNDHNHDYSTAYDFQYDKNGNMTVDKDRKIVAIQYNLLNLPDVIQFSNGNQIKNRYMADGRKLGTEYFTQLTSIQPLAEGTILNQVYQANVVDQVGTAYVGNFEYKTYWNVPNYITLKKVFNAEGYVDEYSNNQTYSGYVYYRKDHLGNNREVWRAGKPGGAAALTLQRTWYYPSGLPWNYTTGTGASVQPYKYNSKEFIEMHGFDSYDYSARMMYPAIGGRFMTVDPLCEKRPWMSPYVYCSDNPLNRIDPDGRLDWPVNRTYNGYGRRHENNWHASRPHGRLHQGVDINHTGGGNTDQGAPIVATHSGTVSKVGHAGDGDGGGNRIKITSSDGTVSTSYMHLDATSSGLKVGSEIQEGQQIGTMGRSGANGQSDYTSHLHYEVSVDGSKINPANGANHLVDPQKIIDSRSPAQQPEYSAGALPEVTVVGQSPKATHRPLPQIPVTEIKTPEIKPNQN